mmetsp:Transcript_1374/g.1836  ORF Transcript_1374/g.1836 Transcript_1374/m.1836 type:complete len:548 (-) Transcript_1374:68-1711(-)
MSDEPAQKKAKVERKDDLQPTSGFVDAMLTDMYQISMGYAYWNTGRTEEPSVFDLFFRDHPFKGEFTIFAGLEECLRFIATFGFNEENIAYLKRMHPTWKAGYFDYLAKVDCSQVRVYALEEGSVCIPRVPLLRIEGPLGVCQLLETTLLVLVNFASLIATNAARHRLAAGPGKHLLEFGLRRAQGPDGAMSASRYAYMGGFDGTSNVKAGQVFGMDVKGTHAHSFVVSFTGLGELKSNSITTAEGKEVDFVRMVTQYREKLHPGTNEGELAAFIAYAQAYPSGTLCLIDTYDTLASGCWNYLFVALALHDCGYKALGVRLDSGDLAYLSKECRNRFTEIGKQFGISYFEGFNIVASNDLSENVLWSLKEQGHEIDTFGIGTNLVTCKAQPALGCVYKLVEINGKPRIKISQDVAKVTIPGKKEAFRLRDAKGKPLLDLLLDASADEKPQAGQRLLCRHPFSASKRAFVTPSSVESLHKLVWDCGKLVQPFPSLQQLKKRAETQLASFREDHLRRLNPTPYKLSLSSKLYDFMHNLWLSESPISELA